MADSTTPIQQIVAGVGADLMVNENFDAASPAMLFGRNAATTSGLTWGYVGGRYNGSAVVNGTLSLTASSANYVVVERATGIVSVSVVDTDWNALSTFMRVYLVVAGASSVTSYEDHRQSVEGSIPTVTGVVEEIVAGDGITVDSTDPANPIVSAVIILPIIIACSDETTDLATGTAKVTFRMPYAMTLTAVRASVNTAPVGSTIQVDINEGGASILSTKLTIDAGEKTSVTAATAAVISDTSLASDAEITIDLDQVGATTPGKGLKVVLIGSPA